MKAGTRPGSGLFFVPIQTVIPLAQFPIRDTLIGSKQQSADQGI